MAVIQRGNMFRADFVLKGTRYLKSFETHDAATQWEAYIRMMVAAGKPIAEEVIPQSAKRMTVQDAFLLAMKDWKLGNNLKDAQRNGQEAVDFFGAGREVASLTNKDRDAFVDHLREGKGRKRAIAIGTVNRKLAAFSKMLSKARDAGEPIAVRVKQFKEGQGRVRFLSEAEEKSVLADFSRHEGITYHNFVALGLDTGARLSEILSMDKRWFRETAEGHWFMTIPGSVTKSGKSRTVPLTSRVVSIIKPMLEQPRFWPENWNRFTITHAWARMRERLKLQDDEEFVFHACRHTCATRLLEKTGNLVLVKDWLGHSDIRVTTRYTKVVASTLVAGVQALEKQKEPIPPKEVLVEKQGEKFPVSGVLQ